MPNIDSLSTTNDQPPPGMHRCSAFHQRAHQRKPDAWPCSGAFHPGPTDVTCWRNHPPTVAELGCTSPCAPCAKRVHRIQAGLPMRHRGSLDAAAGRPKGAPHTWWSTLCLSCIHCRTPQTTRCFCLPHWRTTESADSETLVQCHVFL